MRPRRGEILANAKKVRWLHISDFHFKRGTSYDRDVVLNALIESLPAVFQRLGKPDVIFATGDIAFSGSAAEYEGASSFFDEVLSICGLTREKLFVVPGNHDVDRAGGRGLARTLKDAAEADFYFQSDDLLHVSQRMRNFKTWFDGFFSEIRTFSTHSTCELPEIVDIDGFKLGIYRVNSAAFALDDHDHGKLFIGRVCLADVFKETIVTDANFVIMHHPLDWLSPIEFPQVKSKLRIRADLILTGHMHETDAERTDGVFGSAIHLTAGASYQTRRQFNRAMVCAIDGGEVAVHPLRYEDSPREIWTVDPSLYPESPDLSGRIRLAKGIQSTGGREPSVEPVGHDLAKRLPVDASVELKAAFEQA